MTNENSRWREAWLAREADQTSLVERVENRHTYL